MAPYGPFSVQVPWLLLLKYLVCLSDQRSHSFSFLEMYICPCPVKFPKGSISHCCLFALPVGASFSASEFLGVSHILIPVSPRFQQIYISSSPCHHGSFLVWLWARGKHLFFSDGTLAMSFITVSLNFYYILSFLIDSGCKWWINVYWTSFWYLLFKSCIEKLAFWFKMWG